MFKHYLSLTKPRISFLVLITTYLGYYLGIRYTGSYMLLASEWIVFFHLIIGTLFSCAGACALNQAIEYKSDAKMDRTANRSIPKGHVTPLKGYIFGSILSFLGVLYLYYMINVLVAFLSFLTIFSYICIYTPFKKISSINTLIGAIPGALPPVGGWFAASSEFTNITAAIFAIMFCWQIPHFLSLAYMYLNDYKKGGFVMLPSLYSNQIQTRIHVLFFTLLLISVTFSLYLYNIVGEFYLISNILLSIMFSYYVYQFMFSVNMKTAKGLFFASIIYLPILLILVISSS
tara:strand:- start:571 stop:1437 length:867 start_codon:yes stop_codon:yes gene_type:complete